MALHRTPAEHDANPPSSWIVVKVGDRVWHLKFATGDGVIDSFTTKKSAEAAKIDGLAAKLYEKEGRWFAGLPVDNWKPYVMPIYEYQFGVAVEAPDEATAWEMVRPISEALDALDVEGDSTTDGPFDRTDWSTNIILDVFVPAANTPARLIEPGSAIVSLQTAAPSERRTVYYEGNMRGFLQGGFDTYLLHAASRCVESYPTIAKASLKVEELHQVGTYNYANRALTITDQEALDAWKGSA